MECFRGQRINSIKLGDKAADKAEHLGC